MAAGDIAPTNGLANISQLLEMINGKSSSSTTKSNVSKEGIDALLQQILGGSQGLASVAGGQKSAGLYNSTTNQMLVNDLITRASGEVAKATAGTTTTTKTAPQVTGGNILALLGTKVAGQVLGPTLKGLGKKAGLDTWGDKLAETLGVGNASNQAGAIANSVASGGISGGADVAGFSAIESAISGNSGVASSGVDFLTSLGIDTSSTASSASGIADAVSAGNLSGGADVADFAALDSAGIDAASNAGNFVDAAGPGPIALAAASANIAGDVLSGDGGQIAGDVLGGSTIGDTLGAKWVICTELNSQGRLPKNLYLASAVRALTLSPEVMSGYHLWAIPVTQWMRKSPVLSALLAPVAKERCKYLLGQFSITGWLTVVIGEPICAALGYALNFFGRKDSDWEKLYG